MSVFTKPKLIAGLTVGNLQIIAYFYSFLLIILALTQLYSFDDFSLLIESYNLPGGAPIANLLSGVIVVSEVFALPFLLRMNLSQSMRVISMVLGWLVPMIWILLSLLSVLTVNALSNIGLLGTKIVLLPGWWAVLFSVLIGVLAALTSWGLWPFVEQRTKRR